MFINIVSFMFSSFAEIMHFENMGVFKKYLIFNKSKVPKAKVTMKIVKFLEIICVTFSFLTHRTYFK